MNAQAGDRRPRKTRRGFTLVELLVVVAVIAILIGITIRVGVLVNRRTARTQATGQIEQIKNALSAFYAEHGSYPPQETRGRPHYEGEVVSQPTPADSTLWLRQDTNYPALNVYPDPNFYRGLSCYLMKYRDKYPLPLVWSRVIVYRPPTGGLGADLVVSDAWVLQDPWRVNYNYESKPPYQSYRLWSNGPDKTSGTADDIGTGWTE